MSIKIGVLDSGIGGFSVLSALVNTLSNIEYIYIADQAYLPYGNQPPAVIIQRIRMLCSYLTSEAYDCNLIVIACNTATAIAIDTIRTEFNIPIIGIEPAIKPACLTSKKEHIALCATENMLKSQRLQSLINQYGKEKHIYKVACGTWVNFVEQGFLQNTDFIISDIHKKILPIADKIDMLILGCTHFPFLKEIIEKAIPGHIQLIDPAIAIAKRVRSILKTKNTSDLHTQQNYESNKKAIQNNAVGAPSIIIFDVPKITCFSTQKTLDASQASVFFSKQIQILPINFYEQCQFHILAI